MNVDTIEGLENTLNWLKSTDPDNLLLGDPTGDPLDRMMGSFRKGELINTVKYQIKLFKKMK